jgi:hypothetical protein
MPITENEYPKAFWMPGAPIDSTNPAYAHTKDEEKKFQLEGRTSVYANLGPMLYPRSMYDAEGNITHATSKEHEADLIAKGLSRDPIAKKPEVVPVMRPTLGAIEERAVNNGRLDALDQEITGLKTSLADMRKESQTNTQLLTQLVEQLNLANKKGK